MSRVPATAPSSPIPMPASDRRTPSPTQNWGQSTLFRTHVRREKKCTLTPVFPQNRKWRRTVRGVVRSQRGSTRNSRPEQHRSQLALGDAMGSHSVSERERSPNYSHADHEHHDAAQRYTCCNLHPGSKTPLGRYSPIRLENPQCLAEVPPVR
jgi:hypothetical protein